MQRAVKPNDGHKRAQEQYHARKVGQEARSAYGRPVCARWGVEAVRHDRAPILVCPPKGHREHGRAEGLF